MTIYIGVLVLFTLVVVGVLAVSLCLAVRDRRRTEGSA